MRLRFEPFPESDDLLNAVADGSELLTLDLSDVRFVTPSLLVAAAAIASAHRVRHGVPPQFVPPGLGDPRIYASRMSLGEVLSGLGVKSTGLRQRPQHERDLQLCELRQFESSGEAEQLVNLVQLRCQAASLAFEVEDALTQMVWEMTANCLEHSRVGHGFFAAQLHSEPRDALHFAVADGGIGIRSSLIGTDYECDSDEAAVMVASRRRVTSVRGTERGVGLPNLLNLATGIDGEVTIRSGGIAVIFSAHPLNGQRRISTADVEELAGTLVSGWLPC